MKKKKYSKLNTYKYKIKRNMKSKILFVFTSLIITIISCNKYDDKTSISIISTSDVTNIDVLTANCGGNITSDGGSLITERGVCWSTTSNPTIYDYKTSDSDGAGSFKSSIAGLRPKTKYYVRAYCTNNGGTAYGSIISFTTQDGAIDIDGNVYHAITLGTQTWTVENLKTTHYNNGTAITNITDSTQWSILSTEGYCSYDNSNINAIIYGLLYNWYSVNTGKLAPKGWHVPSDKEWTELEIYLGMSENEVDSTGFRGTNEGGKLKETGTTLWISPNTGATNEIGFNALPGGYRKALGKFQYLEFSSRWWSTTESTTVTTHAWRRYIDSNSSQIYRSYVEKGTGYSIRCIKD
jgi:uncharacterized protein (TIGR02145 family)